MHAHPAVASCLLVLAFGVPANPAIGQESRPGPATSSAPWSTFLDEFFARQLEELGIPGAIVAVVSADGPIVVRGYGLADVASVRPVDPEKTVFRIASVAKVMTALAVLREVEAGRLDLEADVSRYLDIPLDRPEGRKVRVRDLLVHTAGFDERLIGYAARNGEPYPALGDYLKDRLPPVTGRSQDIASYSNHGYALAAYVVERVARTPFRAYAENRLFGPLGMQNTAFIVPPLPDGAAMATEYDANLNVWPRSFNRPYPAGSLGTTAADMSHFLQSFLNALDGVDTGVISPWMAQMMATRQFTHHAALPGYTFGWAEQWVGGRRVLLKGGAAPKHSALLAVLPDEKLGLFVAVNRQEPTLWERLLPRFVELAGGSASTGGTHLAHSAPSDLHRFEGHYLWTRRSRASVEKALDLLLQLDVTAVGDHLRVRSPVGLLPEESWRAEGAAVFRSADAKRIAFRLDEKGTPTHLFMSISGDHFAFERVPPWRSMTTTLVLLAFAVAVTLAFPIVRVAAWLRHRRHAPVHNTRVGKIAALVGNATAFLVLLVLIAGIAAISDADALLFGPSPTLRAAVILSALASLSALAMAVLGVAIIKDRAWSTRLRIHYLATAAAALVFSALLFSYNLIGGRL